jgi:hypothetical protein
MAAPNIVNVTTITAKTNVANLTTATSTTSNILTNAANSGQVYKINHIMIANYSGTAVLANVLFNKSGSGSFYLAGSISVPATSTLVVLGKDTAIYMEESDVVQANVSSNNAAHLVTSYEIIS